MLSAIDNAIQSSFNSIFPKEKFSFSLIRSELKSWDSVSHVKFLYEIEKQLNIRFTAKDAAAVCSIKDIQRILLGKNDL